MLEEESFLDEVGERGLENERGELAGDAERRLDALGQILRQDQKADANGRKHGLGEGADIDDAGSVVEPLHGW